jgi:hypothetical protein
MAAPVRTQGILAWADAVQLRSRLVQAKAHGSSELLRHALDHTNEWFRNHGYQKPELTFESGGTAMGSLMSRFGGHDALTLDAHTVAEHINEAEFRLEEIRMRLEVLRMVRSRLQERLEELTGQSQRHGL